MTENGKVILKAIKDSHPTMPVHRQNQFATGIAHAIESISKTWKADPTKAKIKSKINAADACEVCSDMIYAGSIVTLVGLPQQAINRSVQNSVAEIEEE